jgi:hypothetical protein
VDARRVLLGDWTRTVRDGIDVLRMGLLLAAAGALVVGDVGAAFALALSGGLALVARVVNLPRPYDWGFVLALTLQAVGEAVGWYDTVPWFDRLVHVVLPMLTAPVLYIALARLEVLPDPRDETHARHYVGMGLVTFCLGTAVGALWEIAEWAADEVIGSNLSEGNVDTVGDLVADVVGSVLGALLLVAWARWGWGSVRRVTGVNTYEDTNA